MFTLRTLVPTPTRRDWILIVAAVALVVAAALLGYRGGSAGASEPLTAVSTAAGGSAGATRPVETKRLTALPRSPHGQPGAGARDRGIRAIDGIGPEPRYFQGPYANGNVLEQLMGSEAFEQDLATLGDAMSRDPDAAAFAALQRHRLEDTLERGGLEARDVRIACGLRACLVQFTHGDERRIDAWWRLFNTLPPPRAGVVMSQPRALGGGRWMHRVFLSFDPGVGGIRTRAPGPGR